jgi:putative hydrolase of the HAD superfamily
VFDMDDTLYPREQGLMTLVQARINAFVVEAVGLAPDEAVRAAAARLVDLTA